MLAVGDTKRAGEYAARRFADHRTPLLATVVARAAARLGDEQNALQWINAAAEAVAESSENERQAVAHVLDRAPELVALRADAGFRAARTRVS
jgi:hypothetical protein